MIPISNLQWGDHLPLKKDRQRGDHLTRQIPLKASIHAGLGGHFIASINSDRGGHLSPPLYKGVTSGTQSLTIFLVSNLFRCLGERWMGTLFQPSQPFQ